MRKSTTVLEQFTLFPEIPTNRDEYIETMRIRFEAENNVVAERLAGLEFKRVERAVAAQERASERVTKREAKRAAKAVADEKRREAVRALWASWRPACMEVSGAVASLVLMGGGL